MGYRYAYVQQGVVLDIERRTEQDTDACPILKYYNAGLAPFFIEIRPGDNAPADKEVTRGWIFEANQFREPQPFQINQETGQMYLPPAISAETFWQTFQDNIALRNELANTSAIVDNMLVEQLTQEGALV